MASTINGTSTGNGGLISTGDDSGILNIQTNETTAISIDASQNVSFTKGFTVGSTAFPAFNAYPNANQSVSTNTFTLINYQVKTGVGFDTAGAFNNTGSTVTLNGISVPAYAFAPPVAGYYQISINLASNSAMTRIYLALYKNGSFAYSGNDINATQPNTLNSSWLVYLNGTSDYIQLYAYCTGVSPQWYGDSRYTFFSGVLVRGA